MFSNKYHSISAAVLAATAGHVAGQNVFDASDASSAGWQPDGHYVLKECAGGDPSTCADIKTEPLCAANKTCHWDGSTCQKGSAPPTKTCPGMSQAECAASTNPVCHWDGSCKPGGAPPSSKVENQKNADINLSKSFQSSFYASISIFKTKFQKYPN